LARSPCPWYPAQCCCCKQSECVLLWSFPGSSDIGPPLIRARADAKRPRIDRSIGNHRANNQKRTNRSNMNLPLPLYQTRLATTRQAKSVARELA
jgi:hypothetical protein